VRTRRPSAPSATMSVKVPPMSTPICTDVILARAGPA
jgi:hypothetical protein